MNKALLNSMTEAEQLLVDETTRESMAPLDEDQLLELHARIRRARNKYVKNYRRGAGAAVTERGGRGISYAKNQRDRGKAEIFELALARVSRQVGVLAGRAAAELKAERLSAAARGGGTGPAGRPAAGDDTTPAARRRGAVKTTGGIKKDAATRAQGARRQAKRDAR
jgi:hypothetical protein